MENIISNILIENDKPIGKISSENVHNISLSFLRIAATMAVVFMHTAGTVTAHPEMFVLTMSESFVYELYYEMMNWAVPVFMMITAVLMLKDDRNITFKECVFKYSRRILLALFLFGIPLSMTEIFYNTKTVSAAIAAAAFKNVLQNKSWDHLWYLYELIGVYLMLPVIKRFTDKCGKKELAFVCAAVFFFGAAVPIINAAFGISLAFKIVFPLFPWFYIFVGKYIDKFTLIGSKRLSAVLAAAALTGVALCVRWGGTELASAIKKCFIALAAVFIFQTLYSANFRFAEKYTRIIWKLDRLCFGVYLIHPVFIHLTYRYFNISPTRFGNSAVSIFVFFALFCGLSFAASRLMSLIKPLKKYVL